MLSFFNFTGNDVPRLAGHYWMRLFFRHAEPAEDHGEDTSIPFDGLLGGQLLVDNHVGVCIDGADQYDGRLFAAGLEVTEWGWDSIINRVHMGAQPPITV